MWVESADTEPRIQRHHVCVCMLSHVCLFATPWTVAHQAPLCMGLSQQDTGMGCHFLFQGIFLTLGLNPYLLSHLRLLHWQVDSFTTATPGKHYHLSVQFSSVAQSCPRLFAPMNCSTPGLPVHHQLPEFTQTHVHRVSDAIQPSHPLSSPSPPAPNPSQQQSLFQ